MYHPTDYVTYAPGSSVTPVAVSMLQPQVVGARRAQGPVRVQRVVGSSVVFPSGAVYERRPEPAYATSVPASTVFPAAASSVAFRAAPSTQVTRTITPAYNHVVADTAPQKSSDAKFIKLLESLEAKVELMAQMQKTRDELRSRTQGGADVAAGCGGYEDYSGADDCAGSLDGEAHARIGDYEHYGATYMDPGEQELDWRADDCAVGTGPQHGDNQTSELWDHLEHQRDSVSRLTCTVESLQQELHELRRNRQAETSHGGSSCTARYGFAEEFGGAISSTGSRALDTTHSGTLPGSSCRGAYDSDGLGHMFTVPTLSDLWRTPNLDTSANWRLTSPAQLPLGLAPFSRDSRGSNLELSGDGYTASRVRGCRQGPALSSAPLEMQALGRYFEVTVEDTVTGWVGGLGIGVTTTSPDQVKRMPDKAWRIPGTFIVGYWGCIFLDGTERRTTWSPDTLNNGAKVGLLVTNDGKGDMIVFVDRRPVVRVEGTQLASRGVLYPIVDVFAATRVVTLAKQASPPPPPWTAPVESLELGGISQGSGPSLASAGQGFTGLTSR